VNVERGGKDVMIWFRSSETLEVCESRDEVPRKILFVFSRLQASQKIRIMQYSED